MAITRFKKYNIMLIVSIAVLLFFGLLFITSYDQPENLKEYTGRVVQFKQRDQKWYDSIFYNSNDKYFNLTLEEDLFFTTTGIAYDNIDRDLFEDLIIGDEITITYDDRGHLNNSRIYNIEYNGRNYLNIEHVILEMSNNKKSSQTIGIALISITTVVGVCLFIWNCKTNKKSIQ